MQKDTHCELSKQLYTNFKPKVKENYKLPH